MAFDTLGQANPDADTNTDLYTAPSEAIISTLALCELGGAPTTFRVAIRKDGAALANEHYLVYDEDIKANEHIGLTEGWTLGAGDVVTVRAGSANVAFNLFGQEIE